MRVGVSATAGIGGPQGTAATSPRPTASTTGTLYAAEVHRAKVLALVLFGALVIVHMQKG